MVLTQEHDKDKVTHPKPAVFLDRDGTLNEEKDYLFRREDWAWLPHAEDSLRSLKAAGYLLIVVSNQSGIARGYYTEQDVHELHDWVNTTLLDETNRIDAYYFCPHHPDFSGKCDCRKPQAGLLLRAAEALHIDLSHSWILGDKCSDIEAGLAVGCRAVLLRTGYGEKERATLPVGIPCAAHLQEATDIIVGAVSQTNTHK